MFWCGSVCGFVRESGEDVGAVFLDTISHTFGGEFGLDVVESFLWRAFVGASYLCDVWEEEVVSGKALGMRVVSGGV